MLDCAIIGGGPAGLTAGLYTTRGGLENVTMYEKGMPGGQITQSSEIENYPGVTGEITGMDLMIPWPAQCQKFGLKHDMSEVTRVSKREDEIFEIHKSDGSIDEAHSVIVCTGSTPRRAGFKGENENVGKGLSYCATCDGYFYKGEDVAVIGGGDTALEEALFLAKICNKVYVVHRRDAFRSSPSTIERVKNSPNIELVLNSTIDEVIGDDKSVSTLKTTDSDGNRRDLSVTGVFVFVGYQVNNSVLVQEDGKFLCEMSPNDEMQVDINMKTNVAGLFAAGDVRVDAAKQVVCAAGDGATAAIHAIAYVDHKLN
ncbi:MAG: FAD-dependent oxidoreductase [Campylobacterota bacterium]|nr:FAD-dependent oxidoreductase [Campylobacterota bacterium]